MKRRVLWVGDFGLRERTNEIIKYIGGQHDRAKSCRLNSDFFSFDGLRNEEIYANILVYIGEGGTFLCINFILVLYTLIGSNNNNNS